MKRTLCLLGVVTLVSLFVGRMPAVEAAPPPWAAAHVCGAAAVQFARCHAIIRTDITPSATSPSGYGPADLQSAYKLSSSAAGAGQTVAIVDAYDDPNA